MSEKSIVVFLYFIIFVCHTSMCWERNRVEEAIAKWRRRFDEMLTIFPSFYFLWGEFENSVIKFSSKLFINFVVEILLEKFSTKIHKWKPSNPPDDNLSASLVPRKKISVPEPNVNRKSIPFRKKQHRYTPRDYFLSLKNQFFLSTYRGEKKKKRD